MKKWWQYLLLIPGCLFVDLAALIVGILIDVAVQSGDQGHPAPFVTMVVMLVFGLLTTIVTIYALVKCIAAIAKSRKPAAEPMGQTVDAAYPREPLVPRVKKAVWRCFIPLFVEIPLAVVIVFVSGTIEINNFYNDPSHIGFAIPAGTFLIAFLLFVFTIILALICLAAAVIRNKRNNRIEG